MNLNGQIIFQIKLEICYQIEFYGILPHFKHAPRYKCALDRPKDVLKMSSQKRMMKVPKIDGNSIRTHRE
jgi:hypothetical protein